MVVGRELEVLGHIELQAQAIFPSPQSTYAEPGVPSEIAGDFQECLRCYAANFLFGAAVVGRRVLQSALVEQGAKKYNLVEQINEVSDDILPKRLKEAAQHVRLIGNDAAHSNQVNRVDLENLVNFVTLVLQQIYVLPYQLAQASKVRPIPAKHMPGAATTTAPKSTDKPTKE